MLFRMSTPVCFYYLQMSSQWVKYEETSSNRKGHEGSINSIQINSVCTYLHTAEADHAVVILVRKYSSYYQIAQHFNVNKLFITVTLVSVIILNYLLQIRAAALLLLSFKV